MNKWFVKSNRKNYAKIGEKYKIHPLIAKLLDNRDIEDLNQFIDPSPENSYHDPFLMKDMDRAVDIIKKAIADDKHIRIVGDYDQDGNSSIMTLMDGLGYFTENLSYDIPDRVEDGYGISKRIIDKAIYDGVDLIITCDNGISAIEEVSYAKEKGLELIVTDHHQTIKKDDDEVLPDADAILNPNRSDCKYPFKKLCGAGVAYKLVQAIGLSYGDSMTDFEELLQYVCMGTVCDLVDLVDENRYIVTEGLRQLNSTENYGIKSLIKASSLNKEVDAYALGYILGPAINAGGRLSTAKLGVELFLEENMDKVEAIAEKLVALNNERKKLTDDGLARAIEVIESTPIKNDDIMIVKVDGVHESVCGIIAGRIKERYNHPCLILTGTKEEEILKGSGRSIEEYNIFKGFNKFRDLFESFGGHAMACGLSIKEEKLEKFRTLVNEDSDLKQDDFAKKLYLDSSFYSDLISFDLIEELDRMEPFGKSNPAPLLGDKNLEILKLDLLGKNKNVLKFKLLSRGKPVDGIMFNEVQEKLEYLEKKYGKDKVSNLFSGLNSNVRIDIVYSPQINEYKGFKNIQLVIKDLR
ncbi:MAG: single-stranded-DNA-specific exonuclease RecJ [Finegoldia sp.]|nr:single-stranded-DNA-specific exonuclease RecJ [Finegoldia sp.]